MRISFSPVRSDATLALAKTGPKALTINGDTLDLSDVPDGATVNANGLHPMLIGDIEMKPTGPHLTVILPHKADAPNAARFPADIINPPDGPIAVPGQTAEED